jgi:hypothetical protein
MQKHPMYMKEEPISNDIENIRVPPFVRFLFHPSCFKHIASFLYFLTLHISSIFVLEVSLHGTT